MFPLLKGHPLSRELLLHICQQPVIHIEQDFEVCIKRAADALFLEGKGDKRMKEVVTFFLRNHKFLRTTNDWWLFLSSLASFFEEKSISAVAGRFSKT